MKPRLLTDYHKAPGPGLAELAKQKRVDGQLSVFHSRQVYEACDKNFVAFFAQGVHGEESTALAARASQGLFVACQLL